MKMPHKWILSFRANGHPVKYKRFQDRKDAMAEAKQLLTKKWKAKRGAVWSVHYSITKEID